MKVSIEVSDELLIEAMMEIIQRCLSTSLPEKLPMDEVALDDLKYAFKVCEAANQIIKHCGGNPVDLRTIKHITTGPSHGLRIDII